MKPNMSLPDLLDALRRNAALSDELAEATPPQAYTSQAFLELERDAIFNKQWICVGRSDEFSYFYRKCNQVGSRNIIASIGCFSLSVRLCGVGTRNFRIGQVGWIGWAVSVAGSSAGTGLGCLRILTL